MYKLILSLCLTLSLAACIATRPQSDTYYFPITGNYQATAIPATDACGQTTEAQQLAFLFTSDQEQRRVHPHCDSRLVQAAQYRANDMVNEQYFAHISPSGDSPNAVARRFGCKLPDYYETQGNQIESIGLNLASAQAEWDAWKSSPGHRMHVLGELDFWKQQDDYGFAVSQSSWGKVYVVITAVC